MDERYKRRFARHLVLPEIGEQGQRILQDATVVCIGVGGLGTASAGYLAAMGVGTLILVDGDRVELSNLNRQLLYETGDVGRLKVEAARDRLEDINPECNVQCIAEHVTENNVQALLAPAQIVVDGSDNFPARFLITHHAVSCHIPWVFAAVSGFEAQLSLFAAGVHADSPCLNCYIPEMPTRSKDCSQLGIAGALVGIVGAMQALEAVKYLLDIGTPVTGRLWRYNALQLQQEYVTLARDPYCCICGNV